MSPQARQRGGNTPSTTARPNRRNPSRARLADTCIAPHHPDLHGVVNLGLQLDLPSSLFDRHAWRLHRNRAARRGSADFLHHEIGERLLDRLDDIRRPFADALDLGARDGFLGRRLAERAGVRSVVAAEPAAAFLARCAGPRVCADPDLIPFADGSFDLVVSNLVLHWVADLPGALVQIRRALKPDGVFLAAILGGGTLAELRTVLIEAELTENGGAGPRISPFAELADAAALLQRAGFAMPVADTERLSVSYPDLPALLGDLRAMGETNALAVRAKRPLGRRVLARAAAIYTERFGTPDGRIPATFEILFLTGWAPHRAQPRPRPRGSANRRLADALGAHEMPAGDVVPRS